MNLNKAWTLISEKLLAWLAALIKILPNILLASVILVIGLLLIKVLRKAISKLVSRISSNDTINNLFVAIINFTLIGILLFIVLRVLKLDTAVTSVLAGAGIAGLAIALAFQDIAANFISGIFISIRRPLRKDDIVKLGEYMGKVEAINLRDTVLLTFQGQMVILPNKDVFQHAIENYTMLGQRRVDITIGVSYGDDLEKVKEVTLNAISTVPHISKNAETTFFYKEFADSSINYEVRIWLDSTAQQDYLAARSETIIAIKKAYDANGISLPFPIRTLDFDIKGGKNLSQMLENQH